MPAQRCQREGDGKPISITTTRPPKHDRGQALHLDHWQRSFVSGYPCCSAAQEADALEDLAHALQDQQAEASGMSALTGQRMQARLHCWTFQ
jgi:hypothetical protein